MTEEPTRLALVEINRRFYRRHAARFDSSRERPWPGWDGVLERLAPSEDEPLRVLDPGCGNGRFASYLAARRSGRVVYRGLDSSPELLAAARRHLAPLEAKGHLEVHLEEVELTSGLSRHLAGERFDLIVLFGLLHHIPHEAQRVRLMAELAGYLDDDGVVAWTLWQFNRLKRFDAKVVPWEEYNCREDREAVDLAELERGDYLLTWDGDREHPRYCHLADEDEAVRLASAADLTVLSCYEADGPGGDHNLYLIARRRIRV